MGWDKGCIGPPAFVSLAFPDSVCMNTGNFHKLYTLHSEKPSEEQQKEYQCELRQSPFYIVESQSEQAQNWSSRSKVRSQGYAVEYKRAPFKGSLYLTILLLTIYFKRGKKKHKTDRTCFCNVKTAGNFNLEPKLPTSV